MTTGDLDAGVGLPAAVDGDGSGQELGGPVFATSSVTLGKLLSPLPLNGLDWKIPKDLPMGVLCNNPSSLVGNVYSNKLLDSHTQFL